MRKSAGRMEMNVRGDLRQKVSRKSEKEGLRRSETCYDARFGADRKDRRCQAEEKEEDPWIY